MNNPNWQAKRGGRRLWARVVLGIGTAYSLYSKPDRAKSLETSLGSLYRWAKHKFYIDELYLWVTHRILFRGISQSVAHFDKKVVDGGVDLSGKWTRQLGAVLATLQTGQVQVYAAWAIVGSILLLGIHWGVSR